MVESYSPPCYSSALDFPYIHTYLAMSLYMTSHLEEALHLSILFGDFFPYSPMFPASAAAAAESLQSCPTLCDPIDGSPPGSAAPGILQARTLEWVAISFSNAWKWKVKVKSLSCVRLCETPWTAIYQASPSMGFSRQEYWSGLPLPYLSCVPQAAAIGLCSVESDSLWPHGL